VPLPSSRENVWLHTDELGPLEMRIVRDDHRISRDAQDVSFGHNNLEIWRQRNNFETMFRFQRRTERIGRQQLRLRSRGRNNARWCWYRSLVSGKHSGMGRYARRTWCSRISKTLSGLRGRRGWRQRIGVLSREDVSFDWTAEFEVWEIGERREASRIDCVVVLRDANLWIPLGLPHVAFVFGAVADLAVKLCKISEQQRLNANH
jgi:hypothetical protein